MRHGCHEPFVILKSLVAAKKPVTSEFQHRISNSAFLGLDAVPLTDTVAKMPAVRLNTQSLLSSVRFIIKSSRSRTHSERMAFR
jgi:hypothetical protein